MCLRPSHRTLVADAGPLIALARIRAIPLLERLSLRVLVPAAVALECAQDLSKPGASQIHEAIEAGRLLTQVPRTTRGLPLPPSLGPGERDAIHLALEVEGLALLDDRLARQATRRLGVAIVGTSGLLLFAKQQGALEAVGPSLKSLRETGYYLSDRLVTRVLQMAGERESNPSLDKS